jgi:sortase (surface protein transpeptidase)
MVTLASRRIGLAPTSAPGYTVKMIRVTEPQDVTLLSATAEDALTLITCHTSGRGPRFPQRYLVRALTLGPNHTVEKSTSSMAAVHRK